MVFPHHLIFLHFKAKLFAHFAPRNLRETLDEYHFQHRLIKQFPYFTEAYVESGLITEMRNKLQEAKVRFFCTSELCNYPEIYYLISLIEAEMLNFLKLHTKTIEYDFYSGSEPDQKSFLKAKVQEQLAHYEQSMRCLLGLQRELSELSFKVKDKSLGRLADEGIGHDFWQLSEKCEVTLMKLEGLKHEGQNLIDHRISIEENYDPKCGRKIYADPDLGLKIFSFNRAIQTAMLGSEPETLAYKRIAERHGILPIDFYSECVEKLRVLFTERTICRTFTSRKGEELQNAIEAIVGRPSMIVIPGPDGEDPVVCCIQGQNKAVDLSSLEGSGPDLQRNDQQQTKRQKSDPEDKVCLKRPLLPSSLFKSW